MATPRPIADVDSETEYQTDSETLESELPKNCLDLYSSFHLQKQD